MNSIFYYGKLKSKPQNIICADGRKRAQFEVEVQRPFRNVDGVYECDVFRCQLWKGMSDTLIDHAQLGNPILVRGRLQSIPTVCEEGNIKYDYEIIAEAVKIEYSVK